MNQSFLSFGDDWGQSTWRPPDPNTLPYLEGVKRLSLDTETDGKNPFSSPLVGVSIGWRDENLNLKTLYCPVAHASGNMDPDIVRSWMNWVLRDKELVLANAKYDIQFCRRFGVDLEALGCKPSDVAFPAALLDDDKYADLSLDAIGLKYVGRGKEKFPGDIDKMASYPSWMAGPYAEGDAGLTLETDECIAPFIESENLTQVRALEDSLIYAVCDIERNGCRVDVPKLELWRKEVRHMYEVVIRGLHETTGLYLNPNTGDSMERIFKFLGIAPPVKAEHKKGGKKKGAMKGLVVKPIAETKKAAPPAYTEAELRSLKHPVIDKVILARRLDSLLSKFLDKFHDGLSGDILRAQFHQLKNNVESNVKGAGTVGGRFSSSGGGDLSSGYGFNAQQVIKTKLQVDTMGDHHIIRELFIPDEGAEYFSGDASQIEYRLFAHFSNAKAIIQAYKDDPFADYHGLMMSQIQKVKPEFNDRTITKNVNFGKMYGAGAEQIAITAGVSVRAAEEIISYAERVAPEIKTLMDTLSREAESKGYVSTIMGRRCRFGTHEKRYYAAVNRVIQGSAADIFKIALKAIYDERKTLGITKLRQIVHDEIDGDKDPDPLYTKRLQDFLNNQRVDLRVPILWNLATGSNWKECH